MENTLNTLQRATDITWFAQTMGYVHTEISSPFITVQKDEGIQPATIPLHFLFMLSHNHRDGLQCYNTIQYNTIHHRITMLFFYRGNTMGKYYG